MEYLLTEGDISFCRRAVEDLDDDGNGLINIYDFETVLQRLDMHFEEFELCKLISELDSNNQGVI
jgi:Ca2+-binding EF-hand superfamily protein